MAVAAGPSPRTPHPPALPRGFPDTKHSEIDSMLQTFASPQQPTGPRPPTRAPARSRPPTKGDTPGDSTNKTQGGKVPKSDLGGWLSLASARSNKTKQVAESDVSQGQVCHEANCRCGCGLIKAPPPFRVPGWAESLESDDAGFRVVDIFLSSTFVDMHGERDFIMKHVEPAINEQVHNRRVRVRFIDLRWGLVKGGNALMASVAGVEDCKPWLVFLSSPRYGWDMDTLKGQSYPLLRPGDPGFERYARFENCFDWVLSLAPGLSVTAMELYHALCLHTPTIQTKAHCFMYLRKQDEEFYSHKAVKENRWVFISDDDDKQQRLKDLRDQVQESPCTLVREYACQFGEVFAHSVGDTVVKGGVVTGLERFGQELIGDIVSRIEVEFPAVTVNERPVSEILSLISAHSFCGRSDEMRQLVRCVERVVEVSGKSGTGKSLLLGKLCAQQRQSNQMVLSYFVGKIGQASCNLLVVLQDLCAQQQRMSGTSEELPLTTSELVVQFGIYLRQLARVARGRNCTMWLVLDAVDQFSQTGFNWSWLPSELPPRVKLVVSYSPEFADTFHERYPARSNYIVGLHSWRTDAEGLNKVNMQLEAKRQELPGITGGVQAQLVVKRLEAELLNLHKERANAAEVVKLHLQKRQKELDEEQQMLLLSKKEIGLPLYVSVLCTELSLFGVFEMTTDYIRSLPETLTELYVFTIKSMEEECGIHCVCAALKLLFCARNGLTVVELGQLLKSEETGGASPASWFPRLHRRMEVLVGPRSLASVSMLLRFQHSHARAAVGRRYNLSDDDPTIETNKTHKRLAVFFKKRLVECTDAAPQPRYATELLFHLQAVEAWDALGKAVANPSVIRNMLNVKRAPERKQELMEAFTAAVKHGVAVSAHIVDVALGMAATANTRELKAEAEEVLLNSSDLLRVMEEFQEAESLLLRLHSVGTLGAQQLGALAVVYEQQGRVQEALETHRKARTAIKELHGRVSGDYAVATNNMAATLERMGQLDEALGMYHEVLEVKAQTVGKRSSSYATTVHHMANVYLQQHKLYEAEKLFKSAKELKAATVGEQSIEYAHVLSDLADLHVMKGRLDEALAAHRQVMSIKEATFGAQSASYAKTLGSIGVVCKKQGEPDRALLEYEKALKIFRETESQNEEARTLHNMGIIYVENKGWLDEGVKTYEAALTLKAATVGKRSASYAKTLLSMAIALRRQEKLNDAWRAYEESRGILAHTLGTNSIHYGDVVYNMANMCISAPVAAKGGDATQLMYEASVAFEAAYGQRHKETLDAQRRYGDIALSVAEEYKRCGKMRLAIDVLNQITIKSRGIPRALALSQLAQMTQDPGKALEKYKEAKQIFVDLGQTTASDYGLVVFNTAQLCAQQHKITEAKRLMQEAATVLGSSLGQSDKRTIAAKEQLQRL